MPIMPLLPLGTVFKPKEIGKGGEDLSFIVTGYFPCVLRSNADYDYTVTPWPIGSMRSESDDKLYFCSCNEDVVGQIEFLGAVSEESRLWMKETVSKSLERDDMSSPLARGKRSIAESFGDLPCTIMARNETARADSLPLGSVVAERFHPGRKAMIFQHSGIDAETGETHDYCVCAWPQGVDPGNESFYVIKKEDITAVHFIGYENALSKALFRRLDSVRRF